jgi:hypothetical protein
MNLTYWKIGSWVIHVISWVCCLTAFYLIRHAIHPLVLVVMFVMFLRMEYNMIVKNKKSF